MPADPGVRLIIDYADTADIGMSSAPSANRRRVYHDRAVVVTVAIMQIFETAPTPERRAALEAYLRDELADVQCQAFADYACRGDGDE
jgi:uncharacterized protein (DUF2236 family)